MAGGQRSPLAYRQSNLSIYAYSGLLRNKSISSLNILALLASTQSADNLFHSLTVHCEEKKIICSLHCFFANVSLSSNISVIIFIPIQYRKHFCLISFQSTVFCAAKTHFLNNIPEFLYHFGCSHLYSCI